MLGRVLPEAYNHFMSESIHSDLQRWASAWKIAGEYLARERMARLRAMADDDVREIIARIFTEPLPPPLKRESGLVQQQRLFRKLR